MIRVESLFSGPTEVKILLLRTPAAHAFVSRSILGGHPCPHRSPSKFNLCDEPLTSSSLFHCVGSKGDETRSLLSVAELIRHDS
jgi:hypothetical protein